MKTEVKKIDGVKREISIEVSGDVVKNKFEDVFKRVSNEAKIPGFRPGKAPRDIVEKNYASHIHEQTLRELVPDIYNQAIDKEGLDVIELPEISDVKLDRTNLSFKAAVEISPEINVKDYKGIKIKHKNLTVTVEELKRNIDALKESRKAAAADDNFAKGFGYLNMSELEKVLERQILTQKQNQQRADMENEIIESISKNLDFKVPQSLVNRQLQEMLKNAKVDLAMKGIPRDKIEEHEEKLIAELEPEAKKQVKVYLVLSAIAKKENIPVDDHVAAKVMEFLLKEAKWEEEGK